MSSQDEYDIYFKKFYSELFKFQSGKKSSSKCPGCEGNKRFIVDNDKLTFSCGPKNSTSSKCGPQYTIELPKYIHFRELQRIYNEQINGSFNYEKNNLLEYDLLALSKKMNVKTDFNKQQDIAKDSIIKLKKLISDYGKINNLEGYSENLKILSDKRYKNSIDKQKIMRMINEDELSEPEKKDLRIKYAHLIRENKEFIDMITELRRGNTEFIMIKDPKVIDHSKKNKDKPHSEDHSEDHIIDNKKYSFDEQVKILVEYYKKVDPNKTETDVIRLVNNRRPKGKEKGTRIPTKQWLELCDKLNQKYDSHPIK